MSIIRMLSLVCVVILVISACMSTNVGKSRYPVAAPGFKPSYELAVGREQAWKLIRNVLDREKINIASSDKGEGRLITDNIDGEAKMLIGILGAASHTTRYRYTINIDSITPRRTRLNIACTLESSEQGQGQWLNMNKEDPVRVKSLEDWLYEKIELASNTVMQSVTTPETSTPAPQRPATAEQKKPEPAVAPPKAGISRDEIIAAQRLLNENGYSVGTPDGKIGPKTRQAIMSFQRAHNLQATGTLTPETMEALRRSAEPR